MKGISCLLNFKNNLSKNIPYYDLLIRQINGMADQSSHEPWICEKAVLFADSTGSIVTRICEGYQFTITFFGGLSNCAELKNELCSFGYHFLSEKDAELALLCYIHFGEKCGQKLSGKFAFIIYDAMRRQVFAISSHDGSVPVFYAKAKDDYILSTSLKGILAHPDISKRISAKSLLELLSCQNRISSCIFEDVYMLPCRSFLKISKNGIIKGNYETPDILPQKNDTPGGKSAGIILSGTSPDIELLENLCKNQEKEHLRTSVYAEKFPDDFGGHATRKQHLLIDDGTVLWALESCVASCGFPFLSSYDYLLPIALKRAKGSDETLYFSFPDQTLPKKNYIQTLIKNDAFYNALEDNIKEYIPKSDILPAYPSLIAGSFEAEIKTPVINVDSYKEETLSPICSQRVKTALRHILLDIISKEHSPIIAFFKRSALLRLCEGGFTFPENQSESELISYLIKLNMWFDINRPRII